MKKEKRKNWLNKKIVGRCCGCELHRTKFKIKLTLFCKFSTKRKLYSSVKNDRRARWLSLSLGFVVCALLAPNGQRNASNSNARALRRVLLRSYSSRTPTVALPFGSFSFRTATELDPSLKYLIRTGCTRKLFAAPNEKFPPLKLSHNHDNDSDFCW